MQSKITLGKRLVAFSLAAMLAAPALADKPSWAGEKGGKGNDRGDARESRGDSRNESRNDDRNRGQGGDRHHFNDQHKVYVRDYYGSPSKSGNCPPGLAKKNNGCMPPGQSKKWAVGQPLPRDVVFYEVPQPLVVQIGVPPSGYRYVRVAGDILMIAIGTKMVVDAIQNLGR